MKRFLTVLLCISLLITALSGCNEKGTPKISIATVQNSASAFLSHMIEENGEDDPYIYELNLSLLPSGARYSITLNYADIAVIPVELAAQLHKRSDPKIKILAGISVGGFELVSTKSITDISELKGQTIYISEHDTLMENLLRYLVSFYGIDPFEEIKFEFTSDNYTLIEKISNGDVSFALFESSDAAWAKAEVENLVSYNLTDELAKKLNNPSIVNYCVVARSDYVRDNPKAIEYLLGEIEASLNKSSNLSETLSLAKKHELIYSDYCGEEFLKSCKADFISGDEMKRKLTAYYKLIYKVKRSLLGNEIPSNEIYYIS
ncbi:MAG: hypothetical protein IJD45_07660 [Clostridia bacterium]|nr:hypothetical protein [Clostridia bacterium]